MWSSFYFYFQIFSDPGLRASVPSGPVVEFLEDRLGLVRSRGGSFEGDPGTPWIDLALVHAESRHRWASGPDLPESVNLVIAVGCRRSGSRTAYVELLTRLAAHLGWTLIEEEDDEGREDVVLWAPPKTP